MLFSYTKIQQKNSPYDIARYSHCAVFYDGELYIHGGQLDGPSMDYCDKLYAFNLKTQQWRLIPSTLRPEFRRNHTTTLWKHLMYLYGGCGTWEITKLNDMWVFDFETLQWQVLIPHDESNSENAITARTRHTAHTYNDVMIVFGGNISVHDNEENTNDTFEFNYKTSEWRKLQVSGKIPSARHSHASILHAYNIYVFGGRDVHGNRFNDLFCLDLRNHDWKEIRTHGELPSPRAGLNLMISSENLYLFGGFDGNVFFSDVYSLNLQSGKWSRILIDKEGDKTFCKGYYTTCQDGHKWIHFGGAGETGEKMDDLFIVDLTEVLFQKIPSKFNDLEIVLQED